MNDQLRLGENHDLITLKTAWEKALDLLSSEISRPSFEGCLKTAKPVKLENGSVTICASSELSRIFLDKYSEIIKTALESCLGSEVDISFIVVQQEKASKKTTKSKPAEPSKGTISTLSLQLNDKYTFSSFITGPCNRLAHAAAKALSEKPGRIYNPFFLYGGPGLGKTHLLQAIGHRIIEKNPGLQVAYISGELFTSQYVTALREHRSEEFRRKYRQIDVWLVDDIQFLIGRNKTKEEFFHTFNDLYQLNKQIVLASDRSPRDMNPLEERLKSRFESGLVADIAPADLETRIAILQSKAISEEVELPFDILELIAKIVPSSIRALEGAFVTLLAYSSLMKMPITQRLAEEVLGRYIAEKKFSELTPDAIQRAVSQNLSVEVQDIIGQKRSKEITLARHTAMYLCRELTGYSLQAIGKSFGGRNHASILHAIERIKTLLEKDEELKSKINLLEENLRQGHI